MSWPPGRSIALRSSETVSQGLESLSLCGEVLRLALSHSEAGSGLSVANTRDAATSLPSLLATPTVLGLTQDTHTHTHTQVQRCFLQPQKQCAQRADTPQLLSGPPVSQQRENTPSLRPEEDFPHNSSMKHLLPPSHSFKRANMWVPARLAL